MDIWPFCERIYAIPEIEELCLTLQDKQGANVLLLLWCAWLDARGESLSVERLRCASHIVAGATTTLIEPLRKVRRTGTQAQLLPDSVWQQVKQHMLNAELAIEKHLLLQLRNLTEDPAPGSQPMPPLDRLAEQMAPPPGAWMGSLQAAAAGVYHRS